jgi:ribonucleoside-diphosphate reductase alpha chain
MRRYLDGDIDKGYPRQKNLTEVEAEAAKADGTDTDGGVAVDEGSADNADATADLLAAGESPECPECGEMNLYYSEGCKTCQNCGWSEC